MGVKLIGGKVPMRRQPVHKHKKKSADCIYLQGGLCQCKESIHFADKCRIASWCDRKVKEKDAYSKIKAFEATRQTEEPSLFFEGIQKIPLEKIVCYEIEKPLDNPINAFSKTYEGKSYDKIVVVIIKDGKYVLKGKALYYYAALKLCLKEVDAVILTSRQRHLEKKVKRKGAIIYHVTFGKGKVLSWKNQYLFVDFGEGEPKQLGLYECIQKGLIQVKD